MPQRVVSFDGGLVTSRDPSLLGPGELSAADDCEYLPNNPGPRKMGRASASQITGAVFDIFFTRFTNFPESTKDSLVMSQGAIVAAIPLSGILTVGVPAFVELYTVSGVERFPGIDLVGYRNKYYHLTGETQSRVQSGPITMEGTLGMKANTTRPNLYYGGDKGGSGNGFTGVSGTAVTYWVEERVKVGSLVTKRNPCTSEETIKLVMAGATTYTPRIHRPPTVNSDATHWALFATAGGGAFPTGGEIAEVAIGQDYIDDTRTATGPPLAGTTYSTVAAVVAGISRVLSRSGQPPKATIGTVFEDSLVTNDLDNPASIRFSQVDDFHAFPAFNVVQLADRGVDAVTMIRRIGNVLIVGMTGELWRIYALPRPEDAAFITERVKEKLEAAHGAIGQRASALYGTPDGQKLAYVTRYGIHATDGYSWEDLTPDVDWQALLPVDYLHASLLINNPEKYRLEFYYVPKVFSPITGFDATQVPTRYGAGGIALPSKCLFLNYHPSHLKNGLPKLSGPNEMWRIGGATLVEFKNRQKVYISQPNVVANQHPTGLVAAVAVTDDETGISEGRTATVTIAPAMRIRSSEMYLQGVGGEALVERVMVHHQAGATGQTSLVRLISRSEGSPDNGYTASFPIEQREISTVSVQEGGAGESHMVEIANSDTLGVVQIDYVMLDYRDQSPASGSVATVGGS